MRVLARAAIFHPPLSPLGGGSLFFPVALYWFAFCVFLKIKIGMKKRTSVTENPPPGRSGCKWVISREFGARFPLETNRKRFKFTCSPV